MSLRRDDATLQADQNPPVALWRAVCAPSVLLSEWDGEVVAYVQRTAATHWLDEDAAKVFAELKRSGGLMSTAALDAALEGGIQASTLQSLLEQLAELGLVSPLKSPP